MDIFKFFRQDAIAKRIATDAISMFTKACDKLEKSNKLALNIISKNDAKVRRLLDINKNMDDVILYNDKVVQNIKKIIE